MIRRLPWTLSAITVLVVAACTSDPGPVSTLPPTTTTTTVPVDGAASTAEFLQCMRDNGIEVSDLPFDADGRPRLEWLSAQIDYSDSVTVEALSLCSTFLGEGALDLGYDEQYRQAVVAQLEAFSRCLRARGVDGFPDPIAGFIGIGSAFPVAEIPYDDPDLPAAVDACQGTVFGGSGIVDG